MMDHHVTLVVRVVCESKDADLVRSAVDEAVGKHHATIILSDADPCDQQDIASAADRGHFQRKKP